MWCLGLFRFVRDIISGGVLTFFHGDFPAETVFQQFQESGECAPKLDEFAVQGFERKTLTRARIALRRPMDSRLAPLVAIPFPFGVLEPSGLGGFPLLRVPR